MLRRTRYLIVLALTAVATAAVTALLVNISERKQEARQHYVKLVDLHEAIVDPAVWGQNFPREYDGYRRTVDTQRTRYGGSEAFSKLDEDPAWRRIFAGYAFGVDYREERGHAYSLADQRETLRTKQFKQPGACLQCHAGGMKHVYEQAGGGDLQQGFVQVSAMPLQEAWALVEHPIARASWRGSAR
jgi:nitrite reductase (cytochrome c-552)